jgi:putative nucleotidyltransferase with HDIG domain
MKKIAISDLQLGMYIHEICGSWMDHPFWKTSFLLDSAEDLALLRKSNIRAVWIDPGKGEDMVGEVLGVHEQAVEPEHLLDLQELTMPEALLSKVRFEEEIEGARQVHGRAKGVIRAMFSEVRMGRSLPVEQAYPVVEEIHRSVARNTDALISLVRLKDRDQYTYLHSVAVCALMIGLGKQLGLDGELLRRIGVAGLFHDAGKILIAEEVLNKPDRLTEVEFDTIKSHPRLGVELLQRARMEDDLVLDVCLHHHERVDGRGYPDQLGEKDISLYARMGAVCDVYDAITSDRCYKKGWEPSSAIQKMAEWQKGHFDEKVFHAFVRTVGIYPSGTLVRLKSGRLGTVISQHENSLLTPRVKVFFSTRLNGRIPAEVVDLAHTPDTILHAEDPVKWGFSSLPS